MRGSVQKYSGKRGVSWSYVIDLGRTSEGKRDQKRRRGFPTKKAAEEAMQRELHERRSGTYVERTPLTV
ncbi:MAG: Arm DNA-binding domain-containing protein, partial [Chloroflexota bacterium]|nr:Arm DNA-binding domain-containing protein [Chloroflexota bacterium]